jgi:hypothetical protein
MSAGSGHWNGDFLEAPAIRCATPSNGHPRDRFPTSEDPRRPFGGIKEPGYGRVMSTCGIRELVNSETVSVA